MVFNFDDIDIRNKSLNDISFSLDTTTRGFSELRKRNGRTSLHITDFFRNNVSDIKYKRSSSSTDLSNIFDEDDLQNGSFTNTLIGTLKRKLSLSRKKIKSLKAPRFQSKTSKTRNQRLNLEISSNVIVEGKEYNEIDLLYKNDISSLISFEKYAIRRTIDFPENTQIENGYCSFNSFSSDSITNSIDISGSCDSLTSSSIESEDCFSDKSFSVSKPTRCAVRMGTKTPKKNLPQRILAHEEYTAKLTTF